MKVQRCVVMGAISLGLSVLACPAFAQGSGGYGNPCAGLPSQGALQTALDGAVSPSNNNGGSRQQHVGVWSLTTAPSVP